MNDHDKDLLRRARERGGVSIGRTWEGIEAGLVISIHQQLCGLTRTRGRLDVAGSRAPIKENGGGSDNTV